MWLHKQAGGMSQAEEQSELTTYFNNFTQWPLVFNDQRESSGALRTFGIEQPNVNLRKRFILNTYTVNAPAVDYTLEIRDNGGFPIFSGSANGSNTFTLNRLLENTSDHILIFKLISQSSFTPTSQSIVIQQERWDTYLNQWTSQGSPITYTCTSATGGSATATVNVPEQMPEMKVYDFIINLFKMHLLTSSITTELNGDETLEVLPLVDYYSTGTEHDITKYIDVKETQVERLIPYKEIKFSYKGRKTALITAYDEAYPTAKFGDLNWNAGTDDMDGERYSVGLGFEHAYYERLISSGGALSNVQYGLFVNQDLEPVVGLPLIHCIVERNPSGHLKWNNPSISPTTLTAYNAPTNIDSNGKSIHWGAQFDEWDGSEETRSLYYRFYSDNLQSLFTFRGVIDL